MEMTNWEDAQRKVREWESGVKEVVRVSISEAIGQFIADAEVRNLAPVTVYKYRYTLEQKLKPFCEYRNLVNLDQISVSDMIALRKSWTEAPITLAKRFEILLNQEKAAVQTKTIELGQTPVQVEAILGKPETVINLGSKVTYAYKTMKVIFVDGKVSDVQ